ncbi:MAG TPA: 30S ribosomal protein S6 [Candidatus Margulisiibacteriota bacterium]|nr:30S ribosomal protein S6 [Candidatus Margulisiibacteriota bacterium]
MNKYEAMFIVKSDLPEEERKTLFNQIGEAVTKHKGEISNAAVWAEKKRLHFPLKKQQEGLYYLMDFMLAPAAVSELRQVYKLNENILRVLITRSE